MTIDRMAWAMVGIMQIFALAILGIALAGVHFTWWGILGGTLVVVAMLVGVVWLSRQQNREPHAPVKRQAPRGSTVFQVKKPK
ncbi:MAG: hypothetical protein R3A44_24975 [Caldilineaceae bacterium]